MWALTSSVLINEKTSISQFMLPNMDFIEICTCLAHKLCHCSNNQTISIIDIDATIQVMYLFKWHNYLVINNMNSA